jgi:hypothetical protein
MKEKEEMLVANVVKSASCAAEEVPLTLNTH